MVYGSSMQIRPRLKHLIFGIAWVFVGWCGSVDILPPLLPVSIYTITPASISGEASYSISVRTGGLVVKGPKGNLGLACDPSGRSTTSPA